MIKFFRNGKLVSEVDCLQGLNLLGHAQLDETETGSECGGYGKCGKDRVMLKEEDRKKVNAPTGLELKHLKENEVKAGWRLACQAFPNHNDMEIEVTLR